MTDQETRHMVASCANNLGLTIPELMEHVASGHFAGNTDKLTVKGIADHAMRRLEQYQTFPSWLLDYCSVMYKMSPDWSMAKAEGAIA